MVGRGLHDQTWDREKQRTSVDTALKLGVP